jgi:hypothetical protein
METVKMEIRAGVQPHEGFEIKQPVVITKAALDDVGNRDIVLRGVIDPPSLSSLLVGKYQRGVQAGKYLQGIMRALENTGGVPAITLAMRGHSFTKGRGDFFLHDDIYIIDGLQRLAAAREVLKSGTQPRLGVMIHFDTTEAWERERFELLNTNRVMVAPSVLIRNLAEENAAIKMIRDLSDDSSFALTDRVSWDQRMKRGQLITGQTLLKTVWRLHQRTEPGLGTRRYAEMGSGLEKVMQRIGRDVLRENIKQFWEILDECFNVRGVETAGSAPHIKGGFVSVLAKVFADHQNFWTDSELTVSSDLRGKLALFPINDPYISRLCGGSGQAQVTLRYHIVEHINRGKRSGRLKEF